jgi:uncharacterized membrane protein
MAHLNSLRLSKISSIQPLKQVVFDRWLRILMIVLLVLGIGLRGVNLSQKLYWADEAFTSLRISGYTLKEVAQEVERDQPITVADFQKYQRPPADKNISHTISGLITEEPQLTPLYFVMVRLWTQGFGYSVEAVRSLSVMLGILAIVAMYGLGLELFQSAPIALMAATLLAVSPFHVVYAQEARPYSLLTLMLLLSSGLLLRSLRLPTRRNWLLYGLTVTLGLYAHLTFIFAAIGHGVYLLLLRHWGLRKHLQSYALTMIFSLVLFAPWIAVIALYKVQAQAMTSWSTMKMSYWHLIGNWSINVSRLFFDVGLSGLTANPATLLTLIVPIALSLLLPVYALSALRRSAPPAIAAFIYTQIGVTLLLLWLPDLFSGGRTSTGFRYSIALLIGLQLAVAYLLAVNLINSTAPTFWRGVTIALLGGSMASCVISSSAIVWWHKSPSFTRHIPEVAALINQTKSPLIVSVTTQAADLMRVESLGYYLHPNTQLRFTHALSADSVKLLPIANHNVFIYVSNSAAQPAIEQTQRELQQAGQLTLKPLPATDNTLFKLETAPAH